MHAAESDPRHPGTLWVRNLDWPAPENAAPRVPATFRCLGLEEVESLAQAMRLDHPATIQPRLASGKRCYVAQVESALAAYGWVSWDEEDIGEIGLRIHLMQGEAYIWDCATMPSHRRLRLYTALLVHIAEQLHAEGLCRVWIGADADNTASQGGMALAGFQPVADLVVTRVIGMRQFWVRGRPGVPDSVVNDARRALLGDRDRAWLAALPTIKSIPTRSG
jgi:GNAT superfamily N-acetyltransferase